MVQQKEKCGKLKAAKVKIYKLSLFIIFSLFLLPPPFLRSFLRSPPLFVRRLPQSLDSPSACLGCPPTSHATKLLDSWIFPKTGELIHDRCSNQPSHKHAISCTQNHAWSQTCLPTSPCRAGAGHRRPWAPTELTAPFRISPNTFTRM